MGFLLNLPIKFNPRRRWRSFYLWRQGYLSLQDNGGGGGGCAAEIDRPNYLWPSIEDLISTDDCDDKYVASSNVHPNDSFILTPTSFDTRPDNSNMVSDNDDGINGNCASNYDVWKDAIHADTHHHKQSTYDLCMDRTDYDNHYGGVEESTLLRGYYHSPDRKKRVVIVQERARGLEGYWQRQAYLHSAYKFTRRKSMCERAKVPVRKLRTAWGMVRGMYVKQARCMRWRLRSIIDYARFHHTSFLLLSKHYLRYRRLAGAKLSFNCTKGFTSLV